MNDGDGEKVTRLVTVRTKILKKPNLKEKESFQKQVTQTLLAYKKYHLSVYCFCLRRLFLESAFKLYFKILTKNIAVM